MVRFSLALFALANLSLSAAAPAGRPHWEEAPNPPPGAKKPSKGDPTDPCLQEDYAEKNYGELGSKSEILVIDLLTLDFFVSN